MPDPCLPGQMASVAAEQYLLPTGEDEGAAAAAARLHPLGRRQRRPLAELSPALVRQRLQQKYGPGSGLRAAPSGLLPGVAGGQRRAWRSAGLAVCLCSVVLLCCAVMSIVMSGNAVSKCVVEFSV